ncbi:MAG: SOS response-associated peptidase [Acidimicrobiia bacterium]|nr:SOS response-associated peptidase [Acidimicrobiia bacterium]
MCGRFVAASTRDLLVDWFAVDDIDDIDDLDVDGALPPSYNVAPTDRVYTIVQDGERRLLRVEPWGFVAGDGAVPLINARAETLAERPAFREAFARRRCLLPADGFYEWETLASGRKQPYLFSPRATGPMVFAGLRAHRGTCAIVTSAARPPVARLHDRMPVVVGRDAWDVWLDPAADADELQSLLVPPPDAPLGARPVSSRVNDVRNNDPALLDEAPPPPQPLPLF